MASWTIIGRGKEAPNDGKSFAVTLYTDTNKWLAGGPDVDIFFKAKSGTYKIIVSPENGTKLLAGSVEVAFFRGLNGTSAIGSENTGRASESGVNFGWKLDSK